MPYDITDAMQDIIKLDNKIESLMDAFNSLVSELQAKKIIETKKEEVKP